MNSRATTGQAGRSVSPRRVVASRILLVAATILIGLAAGLVAMFERRAPRHPAPEDPAPRRELSGQRALASAGRTPAPRPALPPAAAAGAAPAERPSTRAENKLVRTQIKAQQYVEEAYPAWRKAHPGEACPRQLIELNEYMDDKDTRDAWGRPMRMQCGAALASGAKGFKVISFGRDGERSEDDVRFGE